MCHKIESFFQSITSPKSYKEMIGQSVKQGSQGKQGEKERQETQGARARVATDEAINSVDVARRKLNSDTVTERGKETGLTARTACARCCCYCYYYYYFY